MTLYANLAGIMGALGPIEKKGKITSTGSGPSYKFARDSDVLAAANPKMAEAGIVLVPEVVELLSMEPTMSGRQMIANIKTTWLCTDGTDEIRFQTFGQGADSGDKALPKAQSNARKYAFFMLYHIVTGDDPDHWASHEQPERGERASASGGARSQPATTPAQASRSPEEERLRDELLALTNGRGREYLEHLASTVGVPEGQRATAAQLSAMIDLALSEAANEPPLAREGGPESAPPAEEASEVGSPPADPDALPPRPQTPEYGALSPVEKAKARAYWASHPEPEQETLAEMLGAPA